MDLPAIKEAEGEREFRVEVDILSRLDHPNLVSLIGYCADGKHRFLVYEYMHNGNLQDHLNGLSLYILKTKVHVEIPNIYTNACLILGIVQRKMDWPQRLKVAVGAARGLTYLHSSSAVGIPIVHRDFKSTNVLLNANFEAKVQIHSQEKLQYSLQYCVQI